MACVLGPLGNERPLMVRISERALRCGDTGSARAKSFGGDGKECWERKSANESALVCIVPWNFIPRSNPYV